MQSSVDPGALWVIWTSITINPLSISHVDLATNIISLKPHKCHFNFSFQMDQEICWIGSYCGHIPMGGTFCATNAKLFFQIIFISLRLKEAKEKKKNPSPHCKISSLCLTSPMILGGRQRPGGGIWVRTVKSSEHCKTNTTHQYTTQGVQCYLMNQPGKSVNALWFSYLALSAHIDTAESQRVACCWFYILTHMFPLWSSIASHPLPLCWTNTDSYSTYLSQRPRQKRITGIFHIKIKIILLK